MKQYIVALMLARSIQGHSQDVKQVAFVPPPDFTLTLSGNFGEIRANHFHGGLDFKTQGVVDKPVRALADGYTSRIRVTNGSRHILDVVHNNGYTTINRHLSGFMPGITRRVEKLQYEKEDWEVEIVPEPGGYPVKVGQQVAWSGNTGYSFGPYLYLDLLEIVTGESVDPMPFFESKIKDTTAPRTEGVMLFPQPGTGIVQDNSERQTSQPNGTRPIEARGVIGSGIKAYDYMDGVHNRYGVRTVVLKVDGTEVFRSVVDRSTPDENRMINSWTYGRYMKSFIDPGNTLYMLRASNDNRGLVTINEERSCEFEYELKNVFGNTSRYHFTVHGKKQPIKSPEHQEKYFFAWDKTNFLQESGLTLTVPRRMLYDNAALSYEVRSDSGTIAYTYQLNDGKVPLYGGCELRIGLCYQPAADTTKYYVARVTPKGGMYSTGGTYEGGFMKTRIRELGTYAVGVDVVPPEIIPVGKNVWGRNGKIVYRLKDKETGIRSYRGTIDGKFAMFECPNLTKPYWECKLDPEYVKEGGRHTVEMTAADDCGNETMVRETFVWQPSKPDNWRLPE